MTRRGMNGVCLPLLNSSPVTKSSFMRKKKEIIVYINNLRIQFLAYEGGVRGELAVNLFAWIFTLSFLFFNETQREGFLFEMRETKIQFC